MLQRTKWIHLKCSREQNGCIHLGRMYIYQIPLKKYLKSHPIVLVCNKEQKMCMYICKMQYMYIHISNIVLVHLDLDIQHIFSMYLYTYIAKIYIRCTYIAKNIYQIYIRYIKFFSYIYVHILHLIYVFSIYIFAI